MREQLIIIGSGPAGYTAALYAARANRHPLVIEGFAWGGLLQTTTDVENFPGFPQGIQGPELMDGMRAQAERFGARLLTDEATAVQLDPTGETHRVTVGGDVLETSTVILATGASPLHLNVPGEDELAARGVSYCATCDAPFFSGVDVAVVGGGDSAAEEALHLSGFARHVTLVHRRDELRASAIMRERLSQTENITLKTPYTVREMMAGDGGMLRGLALQHVETGAEEELAVTGVFVAVGHRPNYDLVMGQVTLDSHGYVCVHEPSTETSVPGVFACGDLTDPTYRQAITAAGTGAKAALDVERYLQISPAASPGVAAAMVERAARGQATP